MKVHILSLSLLAGMLSFVACSKTDVEVVESDYSYTLDKNLITVEMPEEFKHNPSNFLVSDTPNELLVLLNETSLANGATEVEAQVNIKLKRELKTPLQVEFKPSEELLAAYQAQKTDSKALSLDNVEGLSFEIPTGVLSYAATIKVKGADLLMKDGGTYVGVYTLTLVGETEGVQISKRSEPLYIRVFTSPLHDLENTTVSTSTSTPNGWTKMDAVKITATTDYQPGRVNGIVDGSTNPWGNWWVPSRSKSSNHYVKLTFDDAKVVAVRIYQYNTWERKTLKSLDIKVSDDGGASLYSWGQLQTNSTQNQILTLIFDKPEMINTIYIDNMESNNTTSDSFVDIYEIELYTID